MIASLTILALLCYVLAAASWGAALFLHAPASPLLQSRPERISFAARLLLFCGIVLQFAAIGAWCMDTHRSPFASEFGTLSVAAWGIAIVFGAMDWRRKLPALGALSLAVASMLLLRGLLLLRAPVTDAQIIANRLVSLHVLAILFSFALFVLAFGAAILYLIQNRLLKQHQIGGLFRRLPPLETLDRLSYHSVACALPLLTLGITLGFVQVMTASPRFSLTAWLSDPHTLMSLAAWLLYVFYLAARLASGWRGIRLQYVLIVGLVVVLSLYVMPTSTHHFP
jgi:ABC-type transport system involved in cytochrome c biogenesis permease subunit